jgi:hypothetical protein
MASRLLAKLDTAISRTRDPVQLACLRAERAGFLGRHGKVELAHTQLKEIQRQFVGQPHVAVSGWLALAEGQIEHGSRLSHTAHDRFQRARALSAAAQMLPLQALSAAWLAHAEYVRCQRERMAQLCAEALRLAAPDHHAARWRVSLTVACGYHFAGLMDQAQPWYTAARTHAMADGDDAAISALIYNQASLRGTQARWAAAFDTHCERRAVGAVISAQSSGQFDAVTGVQSLSWLGPLLRAQLLVLEGRHAEALALFDECWPRSEPHFQARMASMVLADRAWCLLQLDREAEGRADAATALQSLDAPCDTDDRALAQARLAQVFHQLGDEATAASLNEAAQRDCQTHQQDQRRQAELLDRALDGITP